MSGDVQNSLRPSHTPVPLSGILSIPLPLFSWLIPIYPSAFCFNATASDKALIPTPLGELSSFPSSHLPQCKVDTDLCVHCPVSTSVMRTGTRFVWCPHTFAIPNAVPIIIRGLIHSHEVINAQSS